MRVGIRLVPGLAAAVAAPALFLRLADFVEDKAAVPFVLAGLIGYSRIYLGVHDPSDVIAGCAAATVWAATVGYTNRLIERRSERRQPASRMPA